MDSMREKNALMTPRCVAEAAVTGKTRRGAALEGVKTVRTGHVLRSVRLCVELSSGAR